MKTFKLTISGNTIYKRVDPKNMEQFKAFCKDIQATFTEIK